MDKNLLLAVSLSIVVYVGWFTFLEKRYGPAPGSAPPAESSGAPAPASAPASPAALSKSGGLEGAADFTLGRLQVKVQPMGASLVSFQYPGPLGQIELVPNSDPGFLSTWPGIRFSPASGSEGLAFEGRHPSGAALRKEFLLKDPEGLSTLRLTVSNPTRSPVALADLELSLGPGLGTVASEQKENSKLWSAAALLPPEEGRTQDRFEKFSLKDPDQMRKGPWKWIGLSNRYFLAAVFPPADRFSGYQTGTTRQGDGERAPWIKSRALPMTLAPGASAALEIPFYLGPKGYTHLGRFGLGLERSVEFGYFNTLGRFTLKVLRFFHDVTGNWGWSIILLTALLQFGLFPLTYKSMQSAAAMRRLQPEITKLQQKFSKDPQRLNMEMMQLYKKHGANPLGGCLPMLAQMPVFIALFNTLRNAWELHGAPWMFWIKDLSSQDPYLILPIVMGGFMFAQNKLNPAPTTDPSQAQVMTFMPVLMTFMFLKFPSGLVLYWLTNSMMSFGQQMILKNRVALSR